ncbi:MULTISPECIES: polyprenyl synthetase family protein [Staphylococcus]|uniref:polyprenyl synthetase family protein n=1 Tax=Staphylococcus TaxID=1279 RepID=UPI0001929167|nr:MULTISPECIES: polyprenyl synthetase family protein [Staphylococcus]MBW4836959.1 polyprenyl synthetase family protein [Staphylococcaceae bacterium]AKL91924.1 Heptaprenyl diphosphate synthase component 2 [Staphylococcus capitis subsp. capitis]EEE49568.1 putative heptaprenyl diphosphate synthase component II [Staphylococcus capitis SK14]EFS17559.1 heptaprenyl diphosphate synthase, component II [Staphylococcus capitis C87]EGS37811.1 putative heptaprenyl diphosphate synthase component II [Staphy
MAKLNINNEIKKVEERLERAIQSTDQTLEEASFHLLSSGGKRVRPVFVILSSQFGTSEGTSEDTYRVAVALELIHMATLVHDDVIDKSDKRRGRPTISKKWDQTTAILTGNFLLALGLQHLSEIKDARVHSIISNSIVDVCRGELFQFQDQFNSEQNITNYLRRINRKTALLIQLATEVGAITSGASKETIRKLKLIGHYIGMSFQIIDDVLDFTSSEKKLGKPVGSDLMNGHITLPVLLEMRKNKDFKQKITNLNAQSPQSDFDTCIQTIRKSDNIEESKAISEKYLNKAIALIEELEEGPNKTLFKKLIKKMGSRNK